MRERPNVLIVHTHDTGRMVGGYPHGMATPNIARLAADGVRFQQCFCSAPQCSPSRASLLTGQMPHTHGLIGLTHRGFALHDHAPTLPKLLGAAGYQTLLFGFQHEHRDASQLGYQRVIAGEPRRHHCDDVAAQATAYLADSPAQPFFAQVGFSQTHRVFSTSGEAPLDGVRVPPYLPDNGVTRRDFRDFQVDLDLADAAVGRILDALDEAGLADDTLVIYTTDHGVAFPGAKGTLFDPGVGIASVWRGPGDFAAGRDVDALVSNIDVLPTLCELCGVDVPAEVQGTSLLPLLRGTAEQVHDEVYLEMTYHAGYDPMRGVRTTARKYIRSYEYRPYWFGPNVDDGLSKQLLKDGWQFAQTRPRELLFDLMLDSNETHNVARDPAYAADLEDLRSRVDRFMAATNDPMQTGCYPLPAGAIVTPPTNFQPPEKPE